MTDNPEAVFRTADEIQSLLSRSFRPEAIRSRKIAGKQVQYLPIAAIRERLTRACNTWDFRIVDRRFESLMLSRWNEELRRSEHREIQVYTVVGELTIPELGTRQAIGIQEMDEGSGADLLQGASSDALKKAARLFDAGLPDEGFTPAPAQPRPKAVPSAALAADPETGEIIDEVEPLPAERPASQSYAGPPTTPANEEATYRQRNLIGALVREFRIEQRQLNEIAIEVTGKGANELTRRDASNLIEHLKSRRPDGVVTP